MRLKRTKMPYNFRAICVANTSNGKHICASIWRRTTKVVRARQTVKRRRSVVLEMRHRTKMGERRQRAAGKVFAVMIQCRRQRHKNQWRHRVHSFPFPPTNDSEPTASIQQKRRTFGYSKVKYSPKKKTLRRLRSRIFATHKIPLFVTHRHSRRESESYK